MSERRTSVPIERGMRPGDGIAGGMAPVASDGDGSTPQTPVAQAPQPPPKPSDSGSSARPK